MDPEAGGKKRGQGHQKRFGEERNVFTFGGGQRCWKRLCKNEIQGNWGTKMYVCLNWPLSFGQGLSFFSDQNRSMLCLLWEPRDTGRWRWGDKEVLKPRLAGSTGLWTAHDVPIHLELQLPLFQVFSSRPGQASEHFSFCNHNVS